MSTSLRDIEDQARQLSFSERAQLARTLIEELDAANDENVEALWLAEAKRRYAEYKAGKIQAIDGEEAMARVLKRLG